jgi:hypothetical protein
MGIHFSSHKKGRPFIAVALLLQSLRKLRFDDLLPFVVDLVA